MMTHPEEPLHLSARQFQEAFLSPAADAYWRDPVLAARDNVLDLWHMRRNSKKELQAANLAILDFLANQAMEGVPLEQLPENYQLYGDTFEAGTIFFLNEEELSELRFKAPSAKGTDKPSSSPIDRHSQEPVYIFDDSGQLVRFSGRGFGLSRTVTHLGVASLYRYRRSEKLGINLPTGKDNRIYIAGSVGEKTPGEVDFEDDPLSEPAIIDVTVTDTFEVPVKPGSSRTYRRLNGVGVFDSSARIWADHMTELRKTRMANILAGIRKTRAKYSPFPRRSA